MGLVFMPLFDDVGVIVCGCLVNNALAFSSTMTRSTLSIENAEFHLHPVARYAERQVPHWVGFLAGTLLAFAVSSAGLDDERVFLFVVAVLVALAVVAFAIYGANDSKAKAQLDDLLTVDDPAPDPPQEEHVAAHFRVRCERVCGRYGPVAARGGDLHAAGKGRNAKFIQEELCISSSTVRRTSTASTRKMGINSQQLLIDTVDDEAIR